MLGSRLAKSIDKLADVKRHGNTSKQTWQSVDRDNKTDKPAHRHSGRDMEHQETGSRQETQKQTPTWTLVIAEFIA